MKLYIHSSENTNKYADFNENQSSVGSTLKTYKGSRIQRSKKYGVGKEIGGEVYFHKDYASQIVPEDILESCEEILENRFPEFEYNCMKYDPKRRRVAFQEVSDFNTAREPTVGDWIAIEFDPDGVFFNLTKGHSNYIFHSKWLWVKNDYAGFNVSDAWNWSRRWLSKLKETSDGNGITRWNNQLEKYGLPFDTKMIQ